MRGLSFALGDKKNSFRMGEGGLSGVVLPIWTLSGNASKLFKTLSEALKIGSGAFKIVLRGTRRGGTLT